MRFYLTNKQMKGNFRQLTKVLEKVPFEQSQQEITKTDRAVVTLETK